MLCIPEGSSHSRYFFWNCNSLSLDWAPIGLENTRNVLGLLRSSSYQRYSKHSNDINEAYRSIKCIYNKIIHFNWLSARLFLKTKPTELTLMPRVFVNFYLLSTTRTKQEKLSSNFEHVENKWERMRVLRQTKLRVWTFMMSFVDFYPRLPRPLRNRLAIT